MAAGLGKYPANSRINDGLHDHGHASGGSGKGDEPPPYGRDLEPEMSVSEDPVILIGIDLSCSPAETGIAVAVHARSGTELLGIRRGSDATFPKGATRA